MSTLSIHFDVGMYEHNSIVHGAGGIPPRLSACTNCGNPALFLGPGNKVSDLYDSKCDHVIGIYDAVVRYDKKNGIM